MKLSASLFESIVRGMKSDKSRDKDKRSNARVGISYSIEIVTVHADRRRTTRPIRMRDLSASGLGFQMQQEMAIGEQFMIEMLADAGSVWILCTVARCSKAGDRSFSVGARHAKVINDSQIQSTIAELAAIAKAKLPPAPASGPAKKAATPAGSQADMDRIQRAMFADAAELVKAS